jgi:hypothetical protein
LNGNTSSSASTPDFSWNSDANTGMFRQGTDAIGFSTNGSEKFRINSNGQLMSYNEPGSASTPDFSWVSDANTGIFRAGTDRLGFSTGGTERAQIYSNGYLYVGGAPNTSALWTDGQITIANPTVNDHLLVGIHTTNTDYQASIETTIDRNNTYAFSVYHRGTSTRTFYVAGAGWIYSQGNYLGSDKNIKDDIKTVDSASAKIARLRGVLYKLKVEKQNPNLYPVPSEYMGVIAQEVEAVVPQVVKTFEGGTKGVCYEMLVGLLIEGFKEQSAKITRLETDLANCCTTGQRLQAYPHIIKNAVRNEGEELSGRSFIRQNAPNPFSKETRIEFFIVEKEALASILVFDMSGKLLKTLKLNGEGQGSVIITGSDFRPGMYYYSLIVNNTEIDTKKMILTE